jgi:DNA polymerase III epsilon subunit-like protein
MYGGLQDPGRPLSEDIVRITGLTDFDVLKARGYRWDGDARVWHKTFAESALPLEREFLASQVYGGTNRSSETIVS